MPRDDEPSDPAPPAELRGRRFEHGGEQMVVLSYPVTGAEASGLPPEVAQRLTPAQTEVAMLVLAGRSNAEIASIRRTALSTVAKQLETLYRRLEINSRAELAALVGRNPTAPRKPG